jgi:hypothetical protein
MLQGTASSVCAAAAKPRVSVEDDAVRIRLSLLQRLGAVHFADVCVPLSAIASVHVVASPWRERPWRGLRVGTGLPGVILLGRCVAVRRGELGSVDVDFVAVRRCVGWRAPALVLQLRRGGRWRRVVVTTQDAPALAQRVRQAISGAAQAS